MNRYIIQAILLSTLLFASCDNANDLLNQYIKDGPIIYAGKIDEMTTQSGYYRVRANIFPAEDVNRSHCVLSWNITEGVKDSVTLEYSPANFDKEMGCYYTFIRTISSDSIEGNLEISAQNVDTFGNRSLITTASAYIYGTSYISSLINAQVTISPTRNKISFEPRIGAVGNLLSFEQIDGGFTEEVFVTEESYPLTNAKPGGIVRTKTRYLINKNDIDMLNVTEYLETRMPGN